MRPAGLETGASPVRELSEEMDACGGLPHASISSEDFLLTRGGVRPPSHDPAPKAARDPFPPGKGDWSLSLVAQGWAM